MMIDIEKGRYWDEGIELVSSCTKCSPGCDNCWALAMEKRFRKPEVVCGYERLTIDIVTHPDRLKRFNTRKPKVFSIWNDLFHEAVPHSFLSDVYSHIFTLAGNQYLILTKRPERMSKFLSTYNLPNHIWHGLTVCNQAEADEKIPIFLQVPGNKFLSIEPMLGAIEFIKNIDPIKWGGMTHYNTLSGKMFNPITNKTECHKYSDAVDAVILGGETGPGARPMSPDWVRSVRNQCTAAGVPFFFKSWGKHLPNLKECFGNEVVSPYSSLAIDVKRILDGRTHDELPWVKVVVE